MTDELYELELSYAELVAINKSILNKELTPAEELLMEELKDIIKGLIEDV